MSVASAVAVAATLIWLGMVLAISFLEAPLKFRAPGVTLRLGLGIGRLVFRALNICEFALAAVIVAALVVEPPGLEVAVSAGLAVLPLLIQVLAVRPALTRRSDVVLAGAEGARSRGHYVYIALEVVKVVALLVAAILLLRG